MSNVDLLEVNQYVVKLVVLSDIYGFIGGYIEDGSEPSSFYFVGGAYDPSKGDEGKDYNNPTVRGMDFDPILPLLPFIDLGPVEVTRNEQLIGYFHKFFSVENYWDPNDMDIRDHIFVQSYSQIHDWHYFVIVARKIW